MVHGKCVVLYYNGEGCNGKVQALSADGFVFQCSVDAYPSYQMGRLCG